MVGQNIGAGKFDRVSRILGSALLVNGVFYSLMIGVLASFHAVREYYGWDKVIPIYIEVEDGVRLQRALDRECQQQTPKYKEMCRRFLADTEDFAEEKIQEERIERRFINDSLERCLDEIRSFIRESVL